MMLNEEQSSQCSVEVIDIWGATVFTKIRQRLLAADKVEAVFAGALIQARPRRLDALHHIAKAPHQSIS
jgi:hypothetical protein